MDSHVCHHWVWDWISIIPMLVLNPFGNASQTYQIQWILISSSCERLRHDFSILMLSIKPIGKPTPNLSHLTISSAHGLLARPGSDFSYSDASHKSFWNISHTYPIQWILMSGTSESPGIGFCLFWCMSQIPLKTFLKPIKFNGFGCLALLTAWDMIFLFWCSSSRPLKTLSKTYHIWWFGVSMAPNLSELRFLLFWCLSQMLSKTYMKPIKFNGFSCLAIWVTWDWIPLILVHVTNPFMFSWLARLMYA